ncbi:hypothetical protein Tco_0475514, partial [Tanacetum coccineum]
HGYAVSSLMDTAYWLSESLIFKISSFKLQNACEYEASDDSDSIWRIEDINTPYPVSQKIAEPNKVEREQLYSASANEIDKKKPELKKFPQHLEYAYLHGYQSFPIVISSKLSKREKCYFCKYWRNVRGQLLGKCHKSRESSHHIARTIF